MIGQASRFLSAWICLCAVASGFAFAPALAQTKLPFPNIWEVKFDSPPEPQWRKGEKFDLPVEIDRYAKFESDVGLTIDACIGPAGEVVRAGWITQGQILEFNSRQLDIMRAWNFKPGIVAGKPAGICGVAYVLVFKANPNGKPGLQDGVALQIWTDGSKHPSAKIS